jgi:hypothetical protein
MFRRTYESSVLRDQTITDSVSAGYGTVPGALSAGRATAMGGTVSHLTGSISDISTPFDNGLGLGDAAFDASAAGDAVSLTCSLDAFGDDLSSRYNVAAFSPDPYLDSMDPELMMDEPMLDVPWMSGSEGLPSASEATVC